MSWNRVQFKTEARAQADAENSKRWSDTTVDALFAYVFDEGWRRILNGNSSYRYTKLQLPANSDGLVTIAAVNTALSPDRFNRVLDPKQVRDFRLATPGNLVLMPYVSGSNINFGPAGGSTTVAFWVNHLPENPQNTGFTNTEAVTWPDGHELVLSYHLAAMLLTKGAVESRAAADLFTVCDAMYTSMIQSLMDRTTAHQQVTPSDSALDWSTGGDPW